LVAARFRFAALAPRVAPDTIESGPLLLEQESGRAFAGGRDLGLSPVESAMLGALVRNAGRCLSREEILRDMHGEGGGNVQARTIDTTVVAVRRKLGRAGRCLETVRGAGYRWNAERRPFPRWVRGGAGALLVALGFALHAGVAELGPHAENAETKPHAESAESAESKSHAESAELAEAQSPPPAAAAPLECRVYDVPPALLAALARPPSYKVTVVCVPSPRAGNAATAWVEATSDGTTWRRLAPVTPASLVKTIVFSNPIRDVRVVSDAPGPPAYDIREVVLAN
ncbi:MAG: winged helix-turn-helix transcriptional regulator, partial [Kiritimatiellae bacterium]|nr:winged helix-turn-helix transcriptional regulator [Kiritimatiellia bacterium]